jgi:endonuclease G, mitochondrial
VIPGPVFRDDDPVYEDEEFGPVPIPRRLWKIVAYVEDGEPKVFAILADQSDVLDKLIASRGEAREAAFEWPRGLSREFKSTVEEIAELTGLDFGDLANHDVFAGGGESLEKRVIYSAEALFPDRRTENGFGTFPSIGDFLERWEESRRSEPGVVAEEGAERRRPPAPAPRNRRVVEVGAEVSRVFADDFSGAKHQQFTVKLSELLDVDDRVKNDVQAALDGGLEVRLAVRFGDSRGLPDRIPGIRSGVDLRIKGEWITADEAFGVGGERLAVLHFTHDPLGFICTPVQCFN